MGLLEDRPGLLFVIATLLPLASFLLIFLAKGAWCLLRPHKDQPWAAPLYHALGGDVGGRGGAYVALGAIVLAFLFSLVGFLKFNGEQSGWEHVIEEQEHAVEQLRSKGQNAEGERKRTLALVPTVEVEAAVTGLAVPQGQPWTTLGMTASVEPGVLAPVDARVADLERQVGSEESHLQSLEQRKEHRQAHGWGGRIPWISLTSAGLADPDRGTALFLGYAVDNLTAVMFLMVTFVASLIHLFSMGYMSEELQEEVEDHQVHKEFGHLTRAGRFGRFFMYLSLFCFSMLNLVLADNLLQVFVSWELVGICSFLLIGFYYERNSASSAANKAFITNRVGDAGFILGIIILWTYLGTLNFDEIFTRLRSPAEDAHGAAERAGKLVRAEFEEDTEEGAVLEVTPEGAGGSHLVLFPAEPNLSEDHGEHFHGVMTGVPVIAPPDPKKDQYGSMPYWMLVVAGLGIFLGCVGKSAQFPLQVWLPDAMEGPTPVSALIHAATMVAAGVYLVARVYPIFSPEALLVIAYVGGITLFVAATIAVVMTDIKKVLAYSTVSQLGYMMLALGVGGWAAGLFHLLTHAFFKALLFLGSGSVIYGCHHEQDMLKMGGLYPKMKITALTMLMGVLAIGGIPFFSGWYSKDSILAQSFGFASVHGNWLLFLLPLVTAGITAFYMFRMWFLTFAGKPRDEHVHEHAHESPWTMTVPLIALAVCSVGVAWGWPLWDASASALEHNIAGAQPTSVITDFGHVIAEGSHGEAWPGHPDERPTAEASVRHQAHEGHHLAGNLALLMVVVGIGFSGVLYLYRYIDPAEGAEQFPGVHGFLMDKWYFDRIYSALVVRPGLVVAGWCRWFDLVVIDGIIHTVARVVVGVSRLDGRFDNGVIDGLVNLIGDVAYGLGGGLRRVQTGFLRSYMLFLVLAAVSIFAVLYYFVARVTAG